MPSRVLPPPSPDYPIGLRDLADPPTLYVRGALPAGPGIAVVGTRGASDEAARFTRELVGELACAGFAIWSGGALGIDAAAHAAALATGAPTVVVAGGGLDWVYPKDNGPLFDEIATSGGALVARVPDAMPPSPPLFLARNEVLAAATLATVVVEAPYRSGARSTAAAARRLGRPVCVVPHAPWHGPGRGCLAEIALGGRLVGSPGDVIEIVRSFAPTRPARSGARRPAEPARALALRRNASQKEAAPAPDRARAGDRPRTKGGPETVRDAAEQMPIGSEREPPGAAEGAPAVLAALGEECLHIDQICEITGLPFAMVSAALLTLTLDAVVVEGPAGSFRRAHRSGRHARAGADRVRRSGESAGFKDR